MLDLRCLFLAALLGVVSPGVRAADFHVLNQSNRPWTLKLVEANADIQLLPDGATWAEGVVLGPGKTIHFSMKRYQTMVLSLQDHRGESHCQVRMDHHDAGLGLQPRLLAQIAPGAELTVPRVLRQTPDRRLTIIGEQWLHVPGWAPEPPAAPAEGGPSQSAWIVNRSSAIWTLVPMPSGAPVLLFSWDADGTQRCCLEVLTTAVRHLPPGSSLALVLAEKRPEGCFRFQLRDGLGQPFAEDLPDAELVDPARPHFRFPSDDRRTNKLAGPAVVQVLTIVTDLWERNGGATGAVPSE